MSTGNNSLVIIYPNPVKDKLNMQVTSSINTNMKAEIYDAAGKVVLSSTRYVEKGVNVVSFDNIKNVPRGVYMAVIRIGNEILKEKLIIAK